MWFLEVEYRGFGNLVCSVADRNAVQAYLLKCTGAAWLQQFFGMGGFYCISHLEKQKERLGPMPLIAV